MHRGDGSWFSKNINFSKMAKSGCDQPRNPAALSSGHGTGSQESPSIDCPSGSGLRDFLFHNQGRVALEEFDHQWSPGGLWVPVDHLV